MRRLLLLVIAPALACVFPQAALALGDLTFSPPSGPPTTLVTEAALALGELTFSPPSGPPTTLVTAHGTGFKPGEAVTVSGFPIVSETTTADARGAFTVTFRVPKDAFPGPVPVTARSATQSAFGIFVVSTPWNQPGRVAGRTGFNQFEGVLGTDTADDLFVRWRVGDAAGEPVVNHNTVYTRTPRGFASYQIFCREPAVVCDPPLAQATFPMPFGFKSSTSPIIGVNRMYVGGSSRVFAFNSACKRGTCTPVWTRGFSSQPKSITFAHGILYVVTFDGRLRGFDAAACEAAAGSCGPVSSFPAGGGFRLPAVANDRIAVVQGGSPSELQVFAESCRGRCKPLWHAPIGDFETPTPVIAGGKVVLISEGHVRAYATDCRADGGVCDPLWVSAGGNHGGRPAVAGGRVYANGLRQVAGVFESDMRAYELGCRTDGSSCPAAWRWSSGPGSDRQDPVVANGVVYAPSGTKVFMLPTACAAVCEPLGFVNTDRPASIAVVDATLLAATGSSLTAFSSHKTPIE